MSSIMTNWDYSVSADNAIPPLITVNDFLSITPGLSSTNEQIEAVLNSVSQAVRMWCGWHVAPVLECTWMGDGEGNIALLPSMGVRSIESLSISGVEIDPNAYEWRSSGIVRLTHSSFPDAWRSIVCVYTAGYDALDIGQVVSQIALNMLIAAPGITEEHSGGVGVTYNKTGDGLTGGVSLLRRDKELLAPYRLVRAW